MDNAPQQNRNDNLQMLRFFAAAFVLLTHITFYIHERVDNNIEIWHVGEVGVPIFFVISGFVMHLSATRIPINSDGARIFMHRRISRIFPLYWLITIVKLCIAFAVPAAVLHNAPDLLHSLGSLVLFPMFNSEGQVQPIHGVAWTLLHEMLFYYVFATAMVLRQSPFVFSSLAIVSMWCLGLFFQPESALAYVCAHRINLMFVAGMSLSAWIRSGRSVSRMSALLMLAVAWALLLWPDAPIGAVIHKYYVDAALIVTAAMGLSLHALPSLKRLLISLGDSSYSLYLLHPILAPSVCVLLLALNIRSAYAIVPIAFVACVTVSTLVYRYIESPLNELAKQQLGKVLLKPHPGRAAAKGS